MTIKNNDLFDQAPSDFRLPNNGVAKVEGGVDTLKFELGTFVCEGEFERGMERVLTSFLSNHNRGEQPAVWVSGFFGSGKSHFVRMLQHLWANTSFPGGADARSLVPHLPQTIKDDLTELDIIGRRDGAAPWSAAGSLDQRESLNSQVLRIVCSAAGLPTQSEPVKLALWLIKEGVFERVKAEVEAKGKDFIAELNLYNVSEPFAEALRKVMPTLGATNSDIRKSLQAQFPPLKKTPSVDETLEILRGVLKYIGHGHIPPTLIVLDEVQQYVAGGTGREGEVQQLVEKLSNQFGSRILLVATGQQEMTADPSLSKIQDRFTVPVVLKDQDIDTVVRKVLLKKKPSQRQNVDDALGKVNGEVSRQLIGTKIQAVPNDDAVIVEDYPILPTRRRFWEAIMRQVGAGRAGQLRSQLRIFQEANKEVSDKYLGTVIGADYLYKAENVRYVSEALLDRETQFNIEQLLESDQPLRGRILSVIHLIGLLGQSGAQDTGVRPTPSVVADLLVEDLASDGAKFRELVPKLMKELVEDGYLQEDEGEYHLQTRAGKIWEQSYRRQLAQVSDADISIERNTLLNKAVEAKIPLRITQGTAKQSRDVKLSTEDRPPAVGDVIPVWLRSDWDGVTLRQAEDTARSFGSDSPIVIVHLPRVNADHLNQMLRAEAAARRTLDDQGNATDDETKQAKAAMESRLKNYSANVTRYINEVIADAKVILSGGSIVEGSTLTDRVTRAAQDSARRLFPKFPDADNSNWNKVQENIRKGSGADALRVVGFSGDPDQHPVVKEVLSKVGGNWTKWDAVGELEKAPYGWPSDAIKSAIIVLMDNGHIRAQINGSDASIEDVGRLTRFGNLTLRRETTVLTAMQKLAAKQLLSELDAAVKDDDIASAISRCIAELDARAKVIPTGPPYPQIKVPTEIADLPLIPGNDRVTAFLGLGNAIRDFNSRLSVLTSRLSHREAQLNDAKALAQAAGNLPAAQNTIDEFKAFLQSHELLSEADPVSGIVSSLTELLRTQINEFINEYEAERAEQVRRLTAESVWQELDLADQNRLLSENRLNPERSLNLSDAKAVIAVISARPLDTMGDAKDALPARTDKALAAAVALIQARNTPSDDPEDVPGTKPEPTKPPTIVRVPARSLSTESDVDAYLGDLRQRLLNGIRSGATVVVRGT